MVLNYIVIAWRNLLKNRVVSVINISGLTLGLASAVLAILFARHELTYESNHDNADRIAKIYLGGSFTGRTSITGQLPAPTAMKRTFLNYTISK